MLDFPCSVCTARQTTDVANAGLMIRCTQCGSSIRVPTEGAATVAVDEDDDAVIAFADADEDEPAARPTSTIAPPAVRMNEIAVSSGKSTPAATQSATKPIATSAAPKQPPRRAAIPASFRTPATGKRYGFNCVYCSSRLEATDNMAAQEGQCPTCGSTIVIPILDRYGRLIDPITKQIIKQDPHPVHAYAAAGERAPKIIRQPTGQQIIVCPRCGSASNITSNNCKSCGMPFTMEGTTLEAAGANNAMCLTSLVLGIISIPVFCSHILPVLAIIFGIIGLNQVSREGGSGSGRGMAIAGIVCGSIGLILLAIYYLK